MRAPIVIFLVVVAFVAIGCGDDVPDATAAPSLAPLTAPAVSSTEAAEPTITTAAGGFDVPPVLADHAFGTVRVDDVELRVAIAAEPRLRAQGLMQVTDLGSLDGMVFVWSEDTDATFWMRDTVIPLDIAWFDSEGRFVSRLSMPVCDPGEACPKYAADALYRFALEMPAGTMSALADDSTLELIDGF